jgi:hypothetical protein
MMHAPNKDWESKGTTGISDNYIPPEEQRYMSHR